MAEQQIAAVRNLASEAAGVESATAAWQQALNARQQSAMGMIAATKTSLAALELRVQRDAAATDARVSAIEAAGASCPSFCFSGQTWRQKALVTCP